MRRMSHSIKDAHASFFLWETDMDSYFIIVGVSKRELAEVIGS